MDTDLKSTIPVLALDSAQKADERLKQFIKDLFQQPGIQQAVFTFPIDETDSLSILSSAYKQEGFCYYWEQPSKQFSIVAGESLIKLSSSGTHRFSEIQEQQKKVISSTANFSTLSHPCAGLMFLGGFSFFDDMQQPLWDSFEAASLVVPKWLIVQDSEHTLLTLSFHLDAFDNPDELHQEITQRIENLPSKNQSFSSNNYDLADSKTKKNHSLPDSCPNYKEWETSVNRSVDLIDEQKFQKIVLARQISVPYESKQSAVRFISRLREQYPNCSCFLIRQEKDHTFLGATPEKLASFRDGKLFTEALAGSIQRGQTPEEDSALAQNLSFSSKNQKEHQFVVRDIEQRLKSLAHTVYREEQPKVKKLSNVQHLYTPIRADLKPDVDVMSVLQQLHPTPAVGGYPWEKAAPHIKEFENFDRGWYAGPIGWLNGSGNGEFAVAIRSGLLNGTQAHFFAGCGIVADSDAQSEWEETNLKLRPMLSAFEYD